MSVRLSNFSTSEIASKGSLAILVLLWAIQLCYLLFALADMPLSSFSTNLDFSHYYLSALRLLNQDQELYCSPFSADEVGFFGMDIGDVPSPTNPPFLILLTMPLAMVSPLAAWLVWLGTSVFFVTIATYALLRALAFSTGNALAITLATLLSSPMISNLWFGQSQGIVFALIAFAIICSDKRPILAGAFIGASIGIKLYTLPFLIFLFFAGRYKLFLSSLVFGCFLFLAPGFLTPSLDALSYLSCGLPVTTQWALTTSCNIAIGGLLRTLWYGMFLSEPAQIIPIAQTTSLISALLGCVVPVIAGIQSRHSGRFPFLMACVAASCVIFSPLAWPHYLLLVGPLIFFCIKASKGLLPIGLWFALPLRPEYVFVNSQFHSLQSLLAGFFVWFPSLATLIILTTILWQAIRQNDE